ncbi:flippase [Patescibacteria group bacterium]|nr:flippase [Patescibacteria group bacterium]
MYHALNSLFKRALPHWMYQRLIGDWNKDGIKKYFSNTGWMFAARIISLVISFLTLAVVARYLGPENYGKLSYAQSYVAIFSVFASLGIDQILHRELAAAPEQRDTLLGTAFLTKLFFGSVTFIAAVTVGVFFHSDPILTWLIALNALTFIIHPLGVISLFFQSQVKAKYPSLIAIVVAFVIPALKLLIIYFDQGLLYFGAVIIIEALMYVTFYVYIYTHVFKLSLFNWTFETKEFWRLFHSSWPLFTAGLSGYIYGRIDQVMLQNIINSTAVGHYDVAVRLTELLGFLPGVIVGSTLPALITARKINPVEYRKRLLSLTILCLSIAACAATVLFLLAPFIVPLLYGPLFQETVTVIRVYAWSAIFGIAVFLLNQYLIIEHRSRSFLAYAVLGAVINITLNYHLIPQFGMIGAAYATNITFISIIIFFLLHSAFTRHRTHTATANGSTP